MIGQRDLRDDEWRALCIVASGVTRRSVRNEYDPDRYVRSITGKAARVLLDMGLIRELDGWPGAVEITDAGRDVFGGRTS